MIVSFDALVTTLHPLFLKPLKPGITWILQALKWIGMKGFGLREGSPNILSYLGLRRGKGFIRVIDFWVGGFWFMHLVSSAIHMMKQFNTSSLIAHSQMQFGRSSHLEPRLFHQLLLNMGLDRSKTHLVIWMLLWSSTLPSKRPFTILGKSATPDFALRWQAHRRRW